MAERASQQEKVDAMRLELEELREQVKRANHERDMVQTKLTRATVDQSRTMDIHEDQMQDLKAGKFSTPPCSFHSSLFLADRR